MTNSTYAYQKRNNAGGGLGGTTSTTAVNTSTKIIGMRRDYNVDYRLFYNGTEESLLADTDGATTPPNPRIGRHATTTNGGLNGYMSEFIVFNYDINLAQTLILNNSLAAKYGLTLGIDDIYVQDNLANGNYDFEVAGIGRVDNVNINDDAQGTGIVQILNPTGLGNDEFLIWGHNNGLAQASNVSDIPATVQARFDRVWRVNEVNGSGAGQNVGNIDMRWDLSGLGSITTANLCLLVDTDNDGLFIDEIPIVGATSLGGNIYEFASVATITNNARFTIGTLNNTLTPLPIELIHFEATRISRRSIALQWQTATEINNDFFTIFRSQNGVDWHEIHTTKGAGNSSTPQNYAAFDSDPFSGISYYRPKQTDYDGNFSFSAIRSIENYETENGLEIFPNPTDGKLILRGFADADEWIDLKVLNQLDQEVTALIEITQPNSSTIILDLSNLSPGIYTIITVSQYYSVIRK